MGAFNARWALFRLSRVRVIIRVRVRVRITVKTRVNNRVRVRDLEEGIGGVYDHTSPLWPRLGLVMTTARVKTRFRVRVKVMVILERVYRSRGVDKGLPTTAKEINKEPWPAPQSRSRCFLSLIRLKLGVKFRARVRVRVRVRTRPEVNLARRPCSRRGSECSAARSWILIQAEDAGGGGGVCFA